MCMGSLISVANAMESLRIVPLPLFWLPSISIMPAHASVLWLWCGGVKTINNCCGVLRMCLDGC